MEHKIRRKLIFKGKVQGVGFRPTIYSIAKKLGLTGMVLNSPDGVIAEIEGIPSQVEKFLPLVNSKQMQNAKILRVETTDLPPIGYMSFRILPSANTGKKTVHIPPDIGTCKECEKEMFSTKDRRFGYPFINCTVCGPRFSIIKDVPFDRAKTSMSVFHMCSLCEYEYSDPNNRRFHDESNACDDCGPHVFLLDNYGKRVETLDPILRAVQFLKEGKILAVKGFTGYHIFCDASNPKAIEELRKRKNIIDRPLSLMCYSLKEIKSFVKVTDKESEMLQSSPRPIVILKKRKGILLPENIAPKSENLGVMLPFCPIHYLLVKDNFLALVVTSGNRTGEPITKDNDKAIKYLGGIADYFLVDDRKIINRSDDSIIRVLKNKPLKIRRSRGFVPDPIRIFSESVPSIFATGAQKGNVFGISKGKSAILSQYIGDLSIHDTQAFYRKSILQMQSLFKVKPEVVVFEQNEKSYSYKFAKSIHGVKHVPVLHHHAHIASVMAEHNISGNVIGVALDSQGSGIYVGDLTNFVKKGGFTQINLPSISSPKDISKIALAILFQTFGEEATKVKIDFIKKRINDLKEVKKYLADKNSLKISDSLVSLFDTIACITGLCEESSYTGQTIIELESIASGKGYKSYDFDVTNDNVIDTFALIKEIIQDIKSSVPVENISYKFHNTLGKAIAKACKTVSKEQKIKKVCLSGGLFQNFLLLEACIRELKKVRLEVYFNEKVPSNNGGIALGQIKIAKAVLENLSR